MVNSIIDMRTKNVGDNIVVHDLPKSNYYVACLLHKDVPSMDAFRMVYKGSMGPGQARDPLFDIYLGERQ